MFDLGRSAARGEMTTRRLGVFLHVSPLGDATVHRPFERVRDRRVADGEAVEVGDLCAREALPAGAYTDYAVEVDVDGLTRHVAVFDVSSDWTHAVAGQDDDGRGRSAICGDPPRAEVAVAVEGA